MQTGCLCDSHATCPGHLLCGNGETVGNVPCPQGRLPCAEGGVPIATPSPAQVPEGNGFSGISPPLLMRTPGVEWLADLLKASQQRQGLHWTQPSVCRASAHTSTAHCTAHKGWGALVRNLPYVLGMRSLSQDPGWVVRGPVLMVRSKVEPQCPVLEEQEEDQDTPLRTVLGFTCRGQALTDRRLHSLTPCHVWHSPASVQLSPSSLAPQEPV